MNAKQLEIKIDNTRKAITRLEDRMMWICKKIEYRRRRLRELGKKRAEELHMKLDL